MAIAATAAASAPIQKVSLLRVLGPAHVWALGVGIVLVGEYTGWNFAADKGGTLAALIICWVIGLLYTSVAMIDSEVTSTVAAAGSSAATARGGAVAGTCRCSSSVNAGLRRSIIFSSVRLLCSAIIASEFCARMDSTVSGAR